jgi:hypothetical protein
MMDEETRARLHDVLYYLQENEMKDYWSEREPLQREAHVYGKVLCLMRHFDFEDLLEEDQAFRDMLRPLAE